MHISLFKKIKERNKKERKNEGNSHSLSLLNCTKRLYLNM